MITAIALVLAIVTGCTGDIQGRSTAAGLAPIAKRGGSATAGEREGAESRDGVPEPVLVHFYATGDNHPIPDVSLCRYGFQAPRGYAAGDLQEVTFPTLGLDGGCGTSDESGAGVSHVDADIEILLVAKVPGYGDHLLQLTTGVAAVDVEIRLPGRGLMDAVYALIGEVDSHGASTVTVETPADGLEVTLTSADGSISRIPTIYVDAGGTLVDQAVAGGLAVFAAMPDHAYAARFSHATLECGPGAVNWSLGKDVSVWAKAGLGTFVPGPACR